MNNFFSFIKEKVSAIKSISPVIFIIFLAIVTILTVYLVTQRQIFKSRASGEDVTLCFAENGLCLSPGQVIKKGLNEEFSLDIMISTGKYITGVDVTVEYGNELIATNITPDTTSFDEVLIPSGANSGIDNNPANGQKKARIAAVNIKGQPKSGGDIKLGTITFKGNAVSTSDGQIKFSCAQAVAVVDNADQLNVPLSVDISKTIKYNINASCPEKTYWDGKACVKVYTMAYQIAEKQSDLNLSPDSSKWVSYTDEDESDPVTVNYTFTDKSLGDKYIFVAFKNNNNVVSRVFKRKITYIGGNPTINNLICGFNSASGTGTQIEILGLNFGDQKGGSVIVNDNISAKIISWGQYSGNGDSPTATPIATATATPVASASAAPATCLSQGGQCYIKTGCVADGGVNIGQYDCAANYTCCRQSVLGTSIIPQTKIVATTKERFDDEIKVTLKTADNRIVEAKCYMNLTTVSFSADMQCWPKLGEINNAKIQIYENIAGAKPIVDEKGISFDSEGIVQGFSPKLEIGKEYVMFIKAPKSVRIKTNPFIISEGTTIINNIILPVGDIYPVTSPDGKINSYDKSEMTMEWATTNDSSKPGDLNLDSRVNSIDYSCLKNNFNAEDETFKGPY